MLTTFHLYTNSICLENTNPFPSILVDPELEFFPKLLSKQKKKLTFIKTQGFHTMLVENPFRKQHAKEEQKDLTAKVSPFNTTKP